MVDNHPSEFLKDLARDSENREWQQVGQDFDLVLHDCPINMSAKTVGPFFCKGYCQLYFNIFIIIIFCNLKKFELC
jgi:predicted ArsR family transcriptional regulator